MSEYGGYSPEDAKLQEFGKLAEAMDEEETKIEDGRDTSAEQLDRYLSAAAVFYKWQTHNPHSDRRDEGESNAQRYWKYQNVLNGSYHKEKADFALETALDYKTRIDKRSKHIQHEDTREDTKLAFTAQNAMHREVAANWFHTAANCLSIPEEQPPAPEQQEQTE